MKALEMRRWRRLPIAAAILTAVLSIPAIWYLGAALPEAWQDSFFSIAWIPLYLAVWLVYTRVGDALSRGQANKPAQ